MITHAHRRGHGRTSPAELRRTAHGEAGWGCRSDRGAGTLVAIAVLAVVGLIAIAAAGLGGASVARTQAQGVADLAALAAAYAARDQVALEWASGVPARPCALAREVAEANGAGIARCNVGRAGEVRLQTMVHTQWGEALAESRAGPSFAG